MPTWTTPGTYTWVVPTGITQLTALGTNTKVRTNVTAVGMGSTAGAVYHNGIPQSLSV